MLAPANKGPGAEGRREARQRVLRRAVLIKNAGRASSSCLILDISEGGARVQLPSEEALLDAGVTLIDARTGLLHEATVVWRSGCFAGVSFSSTCTLDLYGSAGLTAGQGALRVLAVDDDPTNRFVLEKALNSLQADIAFAEDGEEAVAAFETASFDVVLMDLRMPRMDGFEAIRRIRSLESQRGTPRTPIIVVSAHTEPGEIAAASAVGADDHVAKPVRSEVMLESIRRLTQTALQAA